MKIILISFYSRFDEYPSKYTLASLRISSLLCKFENVNISIFPFNLENFDNSIKALLSKIDSFKPNILGFSAYVWTWNTIIRIRKIVKNIDMSPNIIIGGPEIPNRIIPDLFGDEILVTGEGEQFWLDFLFEIKNGKTFLEIQKSERLGSCIKKDNYFISPYCKNLICGEPINSKFFIESINNYNCDKDFMWFETSRGCAYNCGYCGHKSRKGIGTYSSDFTVEEIKNIGYRNIKRVFIVDPIIGGTPKNGKTILNNFKKFAPNTQLIAYLRPEYLDDEYISILGSSNIEELRIGIQTLNTSVPKWIRNNNINAIYSYLPKLYDNAIPWRAELIVGLPGDNLKGLIETFISIINQIHPTFIYAYHLSVLKETPLSALLDTSKKEWISIGDNGISAKSSYSYSENDLNIMLKVSDSITNEYNKNISKLGTNKFINNTLSFSDLKCIRKANIHI